MHRLRWLSRVTRKRLIASVVSAKKAGAERAITISGIRAFPVVRLLEPAAQVLASALAEIELQRLGDAC
ncbi:hypothetical protein OURE66S_01493 [Oligella ureolytica]